MRRGLLLLCVLGLAWSAQAQSVRGYIVPGAGVAVAGEGRLHIAIGEPLAGRESLGDSDSLLTAGIWGLILHRPFLAVESEALLPLEFAIGEPYPNPFNPATTIRLQLPRSATAKIVVYNLLGQRVATLADRMLPAGEHRLLFDGSRLASGVYFLYADLAGEQRKMRKLVLVK